MEVGRHSLETEEEKKELGLHAINHGFERDIEETIMKIYEGSLRSGQKIESEGSIVIIGDVNPGAAVIVEENVIVLGVIRGLVHAGAKGNRKARVFANEIDVVQIRIADIVKEVEEPKIVEENDDEDDSKKKKKDRKKEQEELEDVEYEKVKTRAYIKDNEIILE